MEDDKLKRGIIIRICNQVSSHEVYDIDMRLFSLESATGRNLAKLPLKNLRVLEGLDIRHCVTIHDIIQTFKYTGALEFDPYIIPCVGTQSFPVLVLSWDEVILFKRTGFVLAHNEDGLGHIHGCSTDTSFLKCLDDFAHNSKVCYMLWWACLLDAGCVSEKFRETFNAKPEIIEEFMNLTLERLCWRTDYALSDVMEQVKETTGNVDTNADTVYQLRSDGEVKCRFRLHANYIAVETAHDRLHILMVPNCEEGLTGKINKQALMLYSGTLIEADYMSILLHMVLFFAGVRLDYIRWSELQPLQPIAPLNSPYVVEVSTLKDLQKHKYE